MLPIVTINSEEVKYKTSLCIFMFLSLIKHMNGSLGANGSEKGW
jgi:hypothetical protein